MPPENIPLQELLRSAMTHHQAGRLRPAEQLYRQILAAQPDHPDALHLLGVIAHQEGQHHAAVELIRQAIALRAAFPEAYSNLGNALAQLGQRGEAIAAYRQAIALKPDFADAHYNLAVALRGTGDLDAAIAAYHRAIALAPNYAEAYTNLGIALKEKGQFTQAIAAYRQALTLRPDIAQAHYNLGIALKDTGQLEPAVASFQQAIALQPEFSEAYCNLGNAFKDQGRLDDAIACYRRGMTLNPAALEVHNSLIFTMHYHAGYDSQAIAQERERWNQHHAQPLRRFITPHANDPSPDRPLNIGYVSHDLRRHSVAFFLFPLLAAHDRRQFQVTCYSTNNATDDITQRFRASSDAWCSLVGISDEIAADRIRRDRIDILVDLSGHSAGNRLLLFARKPAPVQVSYLGFPGATGLQTIDYRLTDAFADPPSLPSDASAAEQPFRLPQTAWCFTPLSGAPAVAPLPALKNRQITFGCFNNLAKITPPTLDMWRLLLQRLPGARLLLKSIALGSPQVADRFRALCNHHGLDPARLDLIPGETLPLRHLQTYDRVDIALDTFPYHGTTTTCEALWMGVPVVTLAGDRHAARVGVSLLSNIGLPELIAPTPDEYVRIAAALATDLPRLAALRTTLRQRMEHSPLMDAPRFARHVEAAFRTMWHAWCRLPRPA